MEFLDYEGLKYYNQYISKQLESLDSFGSDKQKALAAVLNLFHNNISWQDE